MPDQPHPLPAVDARETLEGLLRYVHHEPGCTKGHMTFGEHFKRGPDKPCSCGLDDAILASRSSVGGETPQLIVSAADLHAGAIAAGCQANIHNRKHPGSGAEWECRVSASYDSRIQGGMARLNPTVKCRFKFNLQRQAWRRRRQSVRVVADQDESSSAIPTTMTIRVRRAREREK